MDDSEALERCIELARTAGEAGDPPFGSLIVCDGQVLAEGRNTVNSDLDPTAHAEVAAIRAACRARGQLSLAGCTLYSSCEPCWICSTAIRMVGIARLVFGMSSPIGGYSSGYPLLRDTPTDRFGPPPEVVPGVKAADAEAMMARFGWQKGSPPR